MKALAKDIIYIKQPTKYSCGPAVICMALSFFRKRSDIRKLCEELAPRKKTGITNQKLVSAIREKGLDVAVRRNSNISELKKLLKLKNFIIINYIEDVYDEGHFAIATAVGRKYVYLIDPLHGKNLRLPKNKFQRRWRSEYGGHKRWLAIVSKG